MTPRFWTVSYLGQIGEEWRLLHGLEHKGNIMIVESIFRTSNG